MSLTSNTPIETTVDGFLVVRLAVYESAIFPGTFFIGCANSGVHLCNPRLPGAPALIFASRAAAEAHLVAREG